MKIDIRQVAPDCQMQITDKDGISVNGYWCRLLIKNEGNTTAAQLEIAIEKLEIYENNEWILYSPFLQSNLIWTHNTHTTYKYFMPQLLPWTFKNIDLGCFTKSSIDSDNDNDIELYVTITANAFTKYNRLPYGKYRFTTVSGAQNCNLTKQKIIVSFFGKWTDDQNEIEKVIQFFIET